MEVPESDWIGKKDISGREIIYTQQIELGSFTRPILCVLINKRDNLELMVIRDIRGVVIKSCPGISYVFRGLPPIAFSLKGGGKIYFGNSGKDSIDRRYKMDYDNEGNMWVRYIHFKKVSDPVLFLSRLWIFIIRRHLNRAKGKK